MKQVSTLSITELTTMAENMYGDMVKAVVDLEKQLVVVDAEMHVDEEQYFLERGSNQQDLWGINLYPAKHGTDKFIEFDSMINIRPSQNNRLRTVESPKIRDSIRKLVEVIVVP